MTWKSAAKIFFALFIFLSVSSAAQQPPKSSENIQWLRYNDSAEGAFDMEVPLGWQIQGGMYRFGYFDARWMMGARSLDGKVVILINDVNVPPYVLPSPLTGREGQPYNKPQQMQMVVARFQEGQPYAEVYAKHRFGDICKSMTPSTGTWQPVVHDKGLDMQPVKISDGS